MFELLKKTFLLVSFGTAFCLSTTAKDYSKPVFVLQTVHSSKVVAPAFSSDDKFLASAGYKKTIKLWNAESDLMLRIFARDFKQQPTELIHFRGIAFRPDGQILAARGNNSIVLFELKTGKQLLKISVPQSVLPTVAQSKQSALEISKLSYGFLPPEKRGLQVSRAFYRCEPETNPPVVAKQ